MASNKILPSHILRVYVWEVLKLNTNMQIVNSLIPVLPIEDEPRVADSGMPYVIYGFAEQESDSMEQIRSGTVSFRIIAPKFSTLGQISNVISSAFESSDIATEKVNIWSTEYSEQGSKPFEGIRFTKVKTSYVEGGEAPETEGGPAEASVNVSYKYINRSEMLLPATTAKGLWD